MTKPTKIGFDLVLHCIHLENHLVVVLKSNLLDFLQMMKVVVVLLLLVA
jgi:hypothetical protein